MIVSEVVGIGGCRMRAMMSDQVTDGVLTD